MKKILLILMLFAIFLIISTTEAFAVPVCPEPFMHKQPDGTLIQVFQKGG